jgi:hypothetical protein
MGEGEGGEKDDLRTLICQEGRMKTTIAQLTAPCVFGKPAEPWYKSEQ